MRIIAALIPAEYWERDGFAEPADQALVAARRIAKAVDVKRERKRFATACAAIERAALQSGVAVRASTIGAEAGTLLDLLPRIGEARVPFLAPPDTAALRAHLPNGLRDSSLGAFGIILVCDPFGAAPENDEHELFWRDAPSAVLAQSPSPDISLCLATGADEDSLPAGLARGRRQVRDALEGSMRLQLGTRHEFLIPALRDFVYLKEAPFEIRSVPVPKMVLDRAAIEARQREWWYRFLAAFLPFLLPKRVPMRQVTVMEDRREYVAVRPCTLPIVFHDGTPAAPFPVLALPPATRPQSAQVIHAGLMSMRHFELDGVVDFYLLRNSELPRGEDASAADQEEAAYAKARHLLTSLLERSGQIRLALYHTGLPPALLGTYRAIVSLLMDSDIRGRLEVVPMLYRGAEFAAMEPWY